MAGIKRSFLILVKEKNIKVHSLKSKEVQVKSNLLKISVLVKAYSVTTNNKVTFHQDD